MSENNQERRQFHRIVMHRPVRITHDGDTHPARLLDVSLKGALLQLDDDWRPEVGAELGSCINLAEGDEFNIEMNAQVAHVDGASMGLKCVSLDLDSASRLRRLVELNLADASLLERELEHLAMPDQ